MCSCTLYKANGDLKQTAPGFLTTTPDVDNVTKFVLDALQPDVLKDDRFVVLCFDLISRPRYFL